MVVITLSSRSPSERLHEIPDGFRVARRPTERTHTMTRYSETDWGLLLL
jgi:hypothetical protein